MEITILDVRKGRCIQTQKYGEIAVVQCADHPPMEISFKALIQFARTEGKMKRLLAKEELKDRR